MSLLIAEGLEKHYGPLEILHGAELRVEPGQRIGLVGRNGTGKTTLLRLIEGSEAPDRGRLVLRRGARLGHVPQRPQFGRGETTRAYVEGGLAEARGVARELETQAVRMGEVEGAELERAMSEHERLTARLEALGGWELERRVETVLSGIGLAEGLWDREARTLSGGEASRAALARELVAGHDLLLLDEPTNHLDLVGIEWLEGYLKELAGAVLVVSHDRRLLRNAVEAILELERGRLVRYPGNYDAYLRLKEERYQSDLRAFEQQQDLLRKEESFIKKHMGSQRTAEAKGRQKKLAHVERLERPFHDVRAPRIRPPRTERGGELVLEAEGLAGGHGAPDGSLRTLFEGLDLRLGRGQRIGVVGPNGAGKSTLLRILAGRAEPLAGRVVPGHGARVGYYDQEVADLRSDGTPYAEVRRALPAATDQEIRDHLARFLFRGEEIERPVAALSGGERARLALAKLVLEEVTWLALDEPTNHLDLAARTALEEMLGEFQGAIVCVSHDRELLDGLCDHTLEVAPRLAGGARLFRGGYSAWRAARAAEVEAAAEAAARRRPEPAPASARDKRKPSNSVRNPYRFEQLEGRIIELEEELGGLRASLGAEEVYRDAERVKETQVRIAELERELEAANAEWESWE